MGYEIPTPESTTSLLAMILGDGISVKDAEVTDFTTQHVAKFVDPDDKLVAILGCDIPFVAYSGAALSMIPVGAAEDMISDNDLSDTVQANFYEVMNICSKLMLSDTSLHLRLTDVVPPGESVDFVAELSEAGNCLGFDIDIPSYGKGKMGFLIS